MGEGLKRAFAAVKATQSRTKPVKVDPVATFVNDQAKRIAELEDVLTGAEIVIRMLAPTGQETTLATIRRALRRDQ
jgi:succinate dehydrogenase/fumarate reductase flavoprotein subunit